MLNVLHKSAILLAVGASVLTGCGGGGAGGGGGLPRASAANAAAAVVAAGTAADAATPGSSSGTSATDGTSSTSDSGSATNGTSSTSGSGTSAVSSGGKAAPAPAPAPSYSTIATENGAFNVASGTVVQYGAGSSWVSQTVSGAGTCSNTFFGTDPDPGVAKFCRVDTAAAPAPAVGSDIVDSSLAIIPASYTAMAAQLSKDAGIAYRYGPDATRMEQPTQGPR